MKYRIKADAAVEAFKYGVYTTPSWFSDWKDNGNVVEYGIPEAPQYCEFLPDRDAHMWHIAEFGDYIIQYCDGSIGSQKAEIFEKVFEPIGV